MLHLRSVNGIVPAAWGAGLNKPTRTHDRIERTPSFLQNATHVTKKKNLNCTTHIPSPIPMLPLFRSCYCRGRDCLPFRLFNRPDKVGKPKISYTFSIAFRLRLDRHTKNRTRSFCPIAGEWSKPCCTIFLTIVRHRIDGIRVY